MTPEERDALIDATANVAAKIAERFYESIEQQHSTAAGLVRKIGAEIAAAIRKELLRKE